MNTELSRAMYNAVLNIELLGLCAERYVVYHNFSEISECPKMKNIIEMGCYRVDVKRNQLLIPNTFVVLPRNTMIKTVCNCCGQNVTQGGEL